MHSAPLALPICHTIYPFSKVYLDNTLDLEEASQPPNLEERLANHDTNNKEIPPLDAAVCALGGVAVGAFTDDNVLLLVLDLGKEL